MLEGTLAEKIKELKGLLAHTLSPDATYGELIAYMTDQQLEKIKKQSNGAEVISVVILDNARKEYPAKMMIKRWTDRERRRRAWNRSFKIIGTLFACSLLGLFIHPILFIIVPAWLALLFSFAPLFTKFLGETVTFYTVDGYCTFCKKKSQFGPYLDSSLQSEMSILCSGCGQNMRARLDVEV